METEENKMMSRSDLLKMIPKVVEHYLSHGCTRELLKVGIFCNSTHFKSEDLKLDLVCDSTLQHLYTRLANSCEHDGWTNALRLEVMKARFGEMIAKSKDFGKKSEQEIRREQEEKMREREEDARQDREIESRKRKREQETMNNTTSHMDSTKKRRRKNMA